MIFDDTEMLDYANEMYLAFKPESEFISRVFHKKYVLIDAQKVDIIIDMLKNKDGTYYFYASIQKANKVEKLFPSKEFYKVRIHLL
jgi:hypothetical protein